MRICFIASSRFPVVEPFHGGLEAHTASLARKLIERGHSVSVFAAPGSDPSLNVDELTVTPFSTSPAARADVGARPEEWMQEHHAYLGLMLDLIKSGPHDFDLIHNNSLHHLPIAMAEATGVPFVTTLHTPPVGWLESAMIFAPASAIFVAVSAFTAAAWANSVTSRVVLNGVDVERWSRGPGGRRAVWTGRLVPEKAPHLAILAAHRAGMALDLAGPIMDRAYFDREVAPLLGDAATYVGHLSTGRLVELVGAARVAVVSPQWDEPYGLVAAEAMSCGTPVAALARGALPELVRPATGALARTEDADGLAAAILEAAEADRSAVRHHAVSELSLDRMVTEYERLYESAGLTDSADR